MKGKNRSSITYGDNAMGYNPAKINIKQGKIEVNPLLWDKLTDEERKVIITHEQGHFHNQNANEIQADKYLIDNYGVSLNNLFQIAKVIDKFVPDTQANLERKQEILKNLILKSQEIKNNSNIANLVWLVPAIEGALGITSVVLPHVLPQNSTKSAWQKLDITEKSKLINDLYFAQAYNIYLKNAGNWNKLIEKNNLPVNDSKSLPYIVWSILAKQKMFDNGSNLKDTTPVSFWQQNTKPNINNIKYPIEIKYKQELIFKKAIYMPIVQLIGISVIAFVVYKFIIKKK